MSKVLMKGNEAFAEAAIRGGCKCYFGYPITPQNEVPEYMSHELPKAGGAFIQAESELAAVNMAYGAAASGGRVFISTSSPGLALMQEGLGFICSCEVPLVVMNVSRGGPGVGGIQPGQADYFQVTRGGYNGDARIPVFAPANIQESVDLIYECFDIAEKYRNPVVIFADGMLGQMMEPVELPEHKGILPEDKISEVKPWAITGTDNHEGRNVIYSLRLQPDVLENHVHHMFEKYAEAERELVRYKTVGLEDAEIVFVAFGTMSRICAEAIELLEEQGVKAGLIRPISLWPFPKAAFDEIGAKTKLVISTELSMGQMIEDVKMACAGRWPVGLINRTGGIVPSSREVADRALKALQEVK
ncbi:MAG: 3-methyl-2-oxobutanoate dehydrogenase subunit VorB [Clostridiales bacterium]|nr:3-methyl-2-oxobutanoate dehydrogenase subunit VorB [Clostridiales bacterium]MDO5140773.1 3-methyl-2-oxobutanoate dehydrogenase subunit VorB [Eubacteriales bacterium]